MKSTSEAIRSIFELYEKYGNSNYIGEAVSQNQHMIQCAMLAEKEGFNEEIVLGALFHDIGHLVGLDRGLERMVTDGFELGITGHERVGEEFLMEFGMPSEVVAFVRGHVDAKRYLVYKDKQYYDGLSKASKQTLEHQSGAMSEDEAKKFENSEKFAAIIRMRQWDELAKDPDAPIEPMEKYKEMCRKYLERKCIARNVKHGLC